MNTIDDLKVKRPGRCSRGLATLAVCVFFAGCASESPQGSQHRSEGDKTASEAQVGESDPTHTDSNVEPVAIEPVITDLDEWNAYYLQGKKVGYSHLRILADDDKRVFSALSMLAIQRFGEKAEQEMQIDATETKEGRLVGFHMTTSMGTEKTVTEGKVEGDRLTVTTQTRGRATKEELPWTPETGGFYAVEESLLAHPMKVGEFRQIRALLLGFNGVADVHLQAVKMESVDVLISTQELLRIDKTSILPNAPPMRETIWTDSTGKVFKSRVAILNLEAYNVPKDVALRDAGEAEFDLGTDVSVPVEKPVPNPRGAAKFVWRVTLEDKNPADVFPEGPFQSVKGVDTRTALVEVRSARAAKLKDQPASEEPEAKYVKPSAFIQSDNEAIKKLAAEATGEQTDPWEKAKALERFAHEYITKTDFSQAFSSAAEVCETKQGDCTEHAVFLAALARAAGIPSRVAVGLVYMEGASAFGYHMWTEVRIGDVWVPIDATLGLGGAGATHLKLGDTALEGGTPFGQFLSLLETAGKLQIQLEE